MKNRQILLASRPAGEPTEADFALAIQLDPSLKPTLEKYLREMKEHNAKARQ